MCSTANLAAKCPEWVDTIEEGKNESIKIFACAPVEADSS
jgi:hypothetical protein